MLVNVYFLATADVSHTQTCPEKQINHNADSAKYESKQCHRAQASNTWQTQKTQLIIAKKPQI